jgi:ABC-type branched-subunit amino acid transport system substrate-binding protein
MKWKILALILLGLGLTGISVYVHAPNRTESKRVGLALSLTGFASSYGIPEANAVAILKKTYPGAGFYIQDTKSNATDGLQAIRKLIDTSKVDIIYTDLSNVAAAAIPLTEEKHKIHVASAYLLALLERGRLTVRNLPSGFQESELVLAKLKAVYPGFSKISVLTSSDEFGESSFASFRHVAEKHGYKVIYRDFFGEETKVIDTIARKTLDSKPDAIYLSSLSSSLGSMVKEIREAGFKGPILSTNAFSFPFIQKAAGRANFGVIYPDFPEIIKSDNFAIEYRKRFNSSPPPTAILTYTAIKFFLENMKDNAKQIDLKKVNGKEVSSPYGKIKFSNREFIYPMIVRYSIKSSK